jgi:hypothetical protein
MTLLSRSGGTSGAFLKHFDLTLEPPEGVQGQAYRLEMKMALRVHDPLTTNLRYDRLGSMRGVVAQGWVRDLGRQLANEAHRVLGDYPIRLEELTKQRIQAFDTWVADPDILLALFNVASGTSIMPVNGSSTIGLIGKVGFIVVPEKFDVQNREVFGRWEVLATLEVQVHISHWEGITPFEIQGLSHSAQVL